MNIRLFICLLLLPFSAIFAQNAPLRLSAAEAVDYGLKNRKDVQNQRIFEKIAQNETISSCRPSCFRPASAPRPGRSRRPFGWAPTTACSPG
ncbi:MAG: hypothetical protein MUD08_14015 [Cytophagales bacterium]|nr:hypothetical protein [Cytophagales bacterium]